MSDERLSGSQPLPAQLQPLFWDYDCHALTWDEDRDLVIARVLAAGDWDAVTWLRGRAGDPLLRQWLQERRGGGLSARRLRFWELILGLSHRRVNGWLAAPGRRIWEGRTTR
ncbi:MAG: hypothetical protein IT330_00890 [Anaerolineae bacterium]|nr:hypothetical protein [Anaerolineae bacterium]